MVDISSRSIEWNPMICLVYVSTATTLFSDDDLVSLLRQARRDNALIDVTGMLLYAGGNFMQALEGDPAQVQALQQRIARDPRHRRMTTILQWPAEDRRFADWSMGFVTIDSIPEREREGFSDFLAQSLERGEERPAEIVLRLLDGFRQTMRP
jgi:hypothetical protein